MAIVGSHPKVEISHNTITRKLFARVVTVMSKFSLRLKNCNNFFSSSPGSQLGKHCHLQSRCKLLKERKAIEMSIGQRRRHHVGLGLPVQFLPAKMPHRLALGILFERGAITLIVTLKNGLTDYLSNTTQLYAARK